MEFIHTLKSDKVRGIARVRLVKNSSPTLPATFGASVRSVRLIWSMRAFAVAIDGRFCSILHTPYRTSFVA